MTRYWGLMIVTLSVLLSCSREDPPAPGGDNITFQLDASVSTKAVKTGWEDGDVIFVFFHQNTGFPQVASPSYLEMKYTVSGDSGTWGFTVHNGPLGIKNGNSGTMRAVYLPFGNAASVNRGGNGDYVFSTEYVSLFWTATLGYTVTDNKVSGNFAMKVPADYVQFSVEDAGAVDGGYRLATDAVRPVEIVSVRSDGSLNLNEKNPGNDMPGYKYGNGYLFSGVMVTDYEYGSNYYFAKTWSSSGDRADCFVSGKTLSSHASVKLPANGDARWLSVGPAKTVTLTRTVSGAITGYGTWYTCNEGASDPDEIGSRMEYAVAKAPAGTTKVLPTKAQMESIRTDLTWTPMSVYGTPGWVVGDRNAFLFFPLNDATEKEYYWTSTAIPNTDKAYHLYLVHNGDRSVGDSPKSMMYAVRYLYSNP